MIDRIDELELAALRSGRDEYSHLKLPALTQLKPNEAAQIAEALPLRSEKAAALRWVMRGLSVEKAVAKVVLLREKVGAIRDKRRFQKELQKELQEGLGLDAGEIEAWKKGK
jgi:hypothetical protein